MRSESRSERDDWGSACGAALDCYEEDDNGHLEEQTCPNLSSTPCFKIANTPDGRPATPTFQNNLLSLILTGNSRLFPLMRQQAFNTLPDIFGLSSRLNRKCPDTQTASFGWWAWHFQATLAAERPWAWWPGHSRLSELPCCFRAEPEDCQSKIGATLYNSLFLRHSDAFVLPFRRLFHPKR